METGMAQNMRASARLERKDDNNGGRQEAKATKDAVNDLMTAFEEFKSTNDDRLKALEGNGSADILSEEKLKRLSETMDQHEDLNQKLTLASKTQKAVEELKEQMESLETSMNRTAKHEGEPEKKARVESWARAVVDAHTQGVANLSEDQRKALDEVKGEYKALSISPETAGGHLAPVEYVREIIKGETEISPLRSLVRVRQTAQKSLEIPKRTGQFAAQWVNEQGNRAETDGLSYGLIEIGTHELYALVDITNQMLEDAAFNMQSEIQSESIEQFAVAEGSAFVAGSGTGQPEGFLTNGEVATTNSGSAGGIADADGQADGLLSLKHAVKTAYAQNATWVMNRTTMGAVRKLKTTDGQYIWQPGIAQGRPNTIDGDPYVEMPDMPSIAAGATPVAYGDWRRGYTWVDRISMEMLRDPYTQATGGKVRFIMRKRVGGRVVLPEAIRTLTCATNG